MENAKTVCPGANDGTPWNTNVHLGTLITNK